MSSASPRMIGNSTDSVYLEDGDRRNMRRIVAMHGLEPAARKIGIAPCTLGKLVDRLPCKQESVTKALAMLPELLKVAS